MVELDQEIIDILKRRVLTSDEMRRLEECDPRAVREVRSAQPARMDVGFSGAATLKRAAADLGPRQVEHVATSERPAGPFKDVVLQSAWDFTRFFETGAPLFWSHEPSTPNLGRVLQMRKAKIKGERVIVSRSEFVPEGLNPFADMIWEYVSQDFIRGVSVGFNIIESVDVSDEERLQLGMGKWAIKVTKAELIELSVTAIPADTAAVKLRELGEELERSVREKRYEARHVMRVASLLEDFDWPSLARAIAASEGLDAGEAERSAESPDPDAENAQPCATLGESDLPQQIAETMTQLADAFGEAQEAVMERFEALTASIDEIADSLRVQRERLDEMCAPRARDERGLFYADALDDCEEQSFELPDPQEVLGTLASSGQET